MVSMGTTWDRTTAVLAERGGTIAPIAIVTLFLPTVVRNAVIAYGPPGAATAAVAALVTIAVLLLTLVGQLAVIAIASDPATTRGQAIADARARLLPALAVFAVALVFTAVLIAPPVAALAAGGIDLSAVGTAPVNWESLPGGTVRFVALYSLALAVVAVIVGTRLFLLNPVILHERLGLGAFARSWQLTRGLFWRLFGVLVLFAIVSGVASLAAQLVVGLIVRLLVGSDAPATVSWLSGAASSAVTTVFVVIANVFTAQLYLAVRGAPAPR